MTDYIGQAAMALETWEAGNTRTIESCIELTKGLLGLLTLKPIETAPHSGVDLLLAVVKDGLLVSAAIGCWAYSDEDNELRWHFANDEDEITPTHWMLPPMIEGED